MRLLAQVAAVTALTIRTIPQRAGSSAVAVVGITGVVVVFVAVLSIAEGFRAAMLGAGSPDTAIVMRGGSDTELSSVFDLDSSRIIKDAPGRAAYRPRAGRLRRTVRRRGRAEAQHRHQRERAAARRRAGSVRHPRRGADCRGARVPSRHERDHRRPGRRHAVRRHRPGCDAALGRERVGSGGDLRGGRDRGRIGDLVRRARPRPRLRPGRHRAVGLRPTGFSRDVRHVQGCAHHRPAARRDGGARDRLLRRPVGTDHRHHHRHRHADRHPHGNRRCVRRDQHDVQRGRDTDT